jgi:hypothetical protein
VPEIMGMQTLGTDLTAYGHADIRYDWAVDEVKLLDKRPYYRRATAGTCCPGARRPSWMCGT